MVNEEFKYLLYCKNHHPDGLVVDLNGLIQEYFVSNILPLGLMATEENKFIVNRKIQDFVELVRSQRTGDLLELNWANIVVLRNNTMVKIKFNVELS